MKNAKGVAAVLLLLAILMSLAGCAIAPVMPPRGAVYTNQKAPLLGGEQVGSKEGTASAYSVLFLVGWGDASLNAAASAAGVKEITATDYEVFNVLGVFQRYTTIVRGN